MGCERDVEHLIGRFIFSNIVSVKILHIYTRRTWLQLLVYSRVIMILNQQRVYITKGQRAAGSARKKSQHWYGYPLIPGYWSCAPHRRLLMGSSPNSDINTQEHSIILNTYLGKSRVTYIRCPKLRLTLPEAAAASRMPLTFGVQ